MRKILLISFTLLYSFIFSQKIFSTVPKITQEDFKKEKSSIDPDAPAEILYRSMKHFIDLDATITTTYILRVKIYDKDKSADFLSPEFMTYETDSKEREKVTSFSAVTYNFENGKITSDKVEKDSKFKSKENKNYIVNKFTFPNVKNGSIVEYKYVLYAPSNFLWSIDRYILDQTIPQKYVDYQLEVPKFLGYNINYRGALEPQHRDVGARHVYGSQYEFYKFGYENVKGFKEEKYVANNDNYKTAIKAELNSTNINGQFKSYALSWNDIAERLYEYEDFGGELKKMSLVKSILPNEIRQIVDKSNKADAILKFVQNNYSWNKDVSISTDKGIKNLLSTKMGNSAEINLLLTMIMKDAGLNAFPVGVSTVSRGTLTSYSPSIAQLNYVFTAVEEDGAMKYYDATSKTSKVYELPRRALNGKGILLDQKKGALVSVFYPKVSETHLIVDAKLNEDASFTGSFKDIDTNLYSNFVKEQYEEGVEDFHKLYKDRYSFSLNNLKSESLDNGNFQTSMDFSSDSFVDQIGNKLVFNPLLFLYSKNHDFDQTETRKAPIEFITAFNKVKKVTVSLPEGYQFENIPSPKKFRTDDDSIVYTYTPTLKENVLEIETSIKVNSYEFEKEYYPAFKQVYDNITKLEGQVVTAVKK